MSESCGDGGKITAFVHRVADDSDFEIRNTTHGGKLVQEVCMKDTEGCFVRLRMSAENMVLLHLLTSTCSELPPVESGLTYTLC